MKVKHYCNTSVLLRIRVAEYNDPAPQGRLTPCLAARIMLHSFAVASLAGSHSALHRVDERFFA